jgi:hypothetical protein
MKEVLRSACVAFVAGAMIVATADGQNSRATSVGFKRADLQAQPGASSNPRVTLFGGLATGDGDFGIGPALAGSFNWRLEQLPFNFRLDPYFAYHSASDPDGSVTILGASANAEIAFTTEGTSEPYLFGGAGLYYNSTSVELPGGGDADDSGVDAGFGLGGGVRFGGFTLEAKMRDINEFTTVSFLVGFMLGGR